MEKSTLVEILRTFSKNELTSLGDLAASPYFNKKSNVLKLCKALNKFAPEFPAEKVTKEEMWKHVYPGKKYNYGIMKNLIYDLNKLVVKFLELEMYSKKTFDNDLNLLDGYRLKNLKSLFIKKAAETRKKLQARPQDNLSHYYSYMIYCSEMSYLDYDFLFRSGETDYHSGINRSLLLFYITNQLYHNTNSIQYAANSSAVIDKDVHENTLKMYEDSPFKDTYTDLLQLSYKALAGDSSKEAYDKLKIVFFENYRNCAKYIQYDLITSIINFCRNNAQIGSAEFVKEEFIYIKLMIEEKIYENSTIG